MPSGLDHVEQWWELQFLPKPDGVGPFWKIGKGVHKWYENEKPKAPAQGPGPSIAEVPWHQKRSGKAIFLTEYDEIEFEIVESTTPFAYKCILCEGQEDQVWGEAHRNTPFHVGRYAAYLVARKKYGQELALRYHYVFDIDGDAPSCVNTDGLPWRCAVCNTGRSHITKQHLFRDK